MKSIHRELFIFSLATLVLSACATTTTNRNLNEKLAQEVTVKDRAGLSAESKDLIDRVNGITAEQKLQLLALRESTQKQMDQFQKESVKLRAILIQDVISQKYNMAEVKLIKGRMASLEKNRIAVIFDTVDKANDILGHDEVDNKDLILEQLMMSDRLHGDVL